ncbi:MAG: hypothetical protein ABUK01_00855 [Leptospirales bacterium]
MYLDKYNKFNDLVFSRKYLTFTFAVAVSMLVALYNLNLNFSRDGLFYLSMTVDPQGFNNIRPGYIFFSSIFNSFITDPLYSAIVFQTAQEFIFFLCLTLFFLVQRNITGLLISLVLATFSSFHFKIYTHFLIDSFVATQASAVLLSAWVYYFRKPSKTIKYTSLILYTAVLPVIAALGKPLVISIYVGVLFYVVLEIIYDRIKNGKFKNLQNFLFSLIPIIIIIVLIKISSSERAVGKHSSNVLEYYQSVLSAGSISQLFKPVINFFHSYIIEIFGTVQIFILPVILLIIASFKSKKSRFFLCILAGHLPIVFILGTSGLRAGQAVTLFVSWVFMFGFVAVETYNQWKPKLEKLSKNQSRWGGASLILILILFLPGSKFDGRILSRAKPFTVSSKLLKVKENLYQLDMADNTVIYYDYPIAPYLKSFTKVYSKGFKHFTSMYRVDNVSLKENAPENYVTPGILFQKWWPNSESQNLLYFRGQSPRHETFFIDLCKWNDRSNIGDIVVLHKSRWKHLVPILEKQFALIKVNEFTGFNVYKIQKKRECLVQGNLLIHNSIAKTVRKNAIYDFSQMNGFKNNGWEEFKNLSFSGYYTVPLR